jgi:D-3-phosphoglycerate dehydrogenase / 2-oxoglutarate reductase
LKILALDNVDPKAVALLEAVDGFDVTAGKLSRDDVMALIPQAAAMIIRSATTVDAEMLAVAPNLKAIARAGVGVDNVDLGAATERGVVVMNTPDGNTISTAEYTLGIMLALARHIPYGYESMQEGRWDRKAFMGVELRGKTLGLIGYGRIGRAVAQRALAFDMSILAYDPYVESDNTATLVDLDTLYAQSDFISLHTVITDETRAMINADSLAKMKPGVRIINAARGALIDDAALAAAVQSGHVAGAAVDVYHEEPPLPDNPLLGLRNVVHTPHLAASTTDAQVQVGVDAAQQIIDALTQGTYRNVVNPDVLK